MTLEAALALYLDYVTTERRLSHRTVETYGQELDLLRRVLRSTGTTLIGRVNREALVEFLNRPRPDGGRLAAGSRNRKLIIIRGFFRFLASDGLINEDPAVSIPWTPRTRSERPAISRADLARLLRSVHSSQPWLIARNRCLIETLFHTGLRLSELLALRLEQIDLRDGLLLRVSRKGGHRQPLPLNREILDSMRDWLNVRKTLRVEGDAVFINRQGNALTARGVQLMLSKVGKAAGFTFNVTPHMLRHGFATELLRQGANLEEVRRLMGHASITTTSRYAHPDQASLRRAVRRLEKKPKKPR